MNKLIVQLLYLLVLLLLSDCKEQNTNDLVVKFYCEANHIRNVSIGLLRRAFLQQMNIVLADCCDRNLNNVSIKAVLEHFDKTCKTFTAVNAFKYQLQHYLFHDGNNATLPEFVVQGLTSLIIGLQTAAKYLQEIAITEGTVCVKFTPKQYMILYEQGLLYVNDTPLSTTRAVLISLIRSALKAWISLGGIRNAITTYTLPNRLLNPSDCIASGN